MTAAAFDLVPDGAWTWFNEPRALVSGDDLHLGFVSREGWVGYARHDLKEGTTRVMRLGSEAAEERDDHNNPGLCLLPDGRLMAVYARHHRDPFYFWRVAKQARPVDESDWLEERRCPASALTTYANPFCVGDPPGQIFNFFRGEGWNPHLQISEDSGESWSPARRLIRTGSGRTRPYLRLSADAHGRIDCLYTDGHPMEERNSLYHCVIYDGMVYDSGGRVLKSLDALPLEHDAGEQGSVIYRYTEDADSGGIAIPRGRAWGWDIRRGRDGQPVCVFQVLVNAGDAAAPIDEAWWHSSRILYFFGKWDGTQWRCAPIAQAGRSLYRREPHYAGGISLDPEDPDVVVLASSALDPGVGGEAAPPPLNPGGRSRLWLGRREGDRFSFQWTPVEGVESGEAEDCLRPLLLRTATGGRFLLWVQGEYRQYSDFQTRIRGLHLENF